ncbi:MAG: glutamine amidotransferase [Kiritimatiellae bacterium]|nr:glutamine amidotransferase [Kiritimatiellia bacterium]
MRKTVWLDAENDGVVAEHEIENPTGESRGVGLYVQHVLNLKGDMVNDTWCLPSSRGVVYSIMPSRQGEKRFGTDWVLDPTAGWIGLRDRGTKRGMVFVFDYNYLQKIYTCGSTAEWFLEMVPVAPGRSFKTTQTIKPVVGFEDFVFASTNVVADIRGQEKGKTVEVTLDLAAISRPLSGVTLEVTVTGWRSKQPLAAQTFTWDRLGYEKRRETFRFAPKAITDGVVIRAVVKGADFQDAFEHYYAGDAFEHERRYGHFATKGGALAGATGDSYALKPPRKVKRFDKPDFNLVARPSPDRFKCLVIFGIFTDFLSLDDAMADWRSQAGKTAEFTWANCPPNAVETFPASYDELFNYDVVVLSDVNFKAIGDIGFEMLCDYVEQGGKLLVTGGPYALGNGEFDGSRFLEVLPVELTGPFDLKWAGKGQSWDLAAAPANDPLLQGVSFDQKPKVFWRHVVTPKKGARVILTAGAEPALVVGSYGRGKVAVSTLSPTGEEGAGEVSWWAWDGWPPLLRNLMTWLNTEEPK